MSNTRSEKRRELKETEPEVDILVLFDGAVFADNTVMMNAGAHLKKMIAGHGVLRRLRWKAIRVPPGTPQYKQDFESFDGMLKMAVDANTPASTREAAENLFQMYASFVDAVFLKALDVGVIA